MIQLISLILDPRMKAGVGLSLEDKEYIWVEIKQILVDHTIQISSNEPGMVPEQEEAKQQQQQQQQQPRPVQLEHDHDSLFEELNLHYEAENKQHKIIITMEMKMIQKSINKLLNKDALLLGRQR